MPLMVVVRIVLVGTSAALVARNLALMAIAPSWSRVVVTLLLVAVIYSVTVRGYRLTAAAGTSALVALFAFARNLNQILFFWPDFNFGGEQAYLLSLILVGGVACALILRLRDNSRA